jgi:hypothetical protein
MPSSNFARTLSQCMFGVTAMLLGSYYVTSAHAEADWLLTHHILTGGLYEYAHHATRPMAFGITACFLAWAVGKYCPDLAKRFAIFVKIAVG